MTARGVSPTRCPLFKLLGSIITELKQDPKTSCLAHSGSTALRTHSLFVTWRKLGVMQDGKNETARGTGYHTVQNVMSEASSHI